MWHFTRNNITWFPKAVVISTYITPSMGILQNTLSRMTCLSTAWQLQVTTQLFISLIGLWPILLLFLLQCLHHIFIDNVICKFRSYSLFSSDRIHYRPEFIHHALHRVGHSGRPWGGKELDDHCISNISQRGRVMGPDINAEKRKREQMSKRGSH